MDVVKLVDTLENASKHTVLKDMKLEDIDLMVNAAAMFIQKARYYVQLQQPKPADNPVPPAPKTQSEEKKDG